MTWKNDPVANPVDMNRSSGWKELAVAVVMFAGTVIAIVVAGMYCVDNISGKIETTSLEHQDVHASSNGSPMAMAALLSVFFGLGLLIYWGRQIEGFTRGRFNGSQEK